MVERCQVLTTHIARAIFIIEWQECLRCLRCYGNEGRAIGAAEENAFLVVGRFVGDVRHRDEALEQ